MGKFIKYTYVAGSRMIKRDQEVKRPKKAKKGKQKTVDDHWRFVLQIHVQCPKRSSISKTRRDREVCKKRSIFAAGSLMFLYPEPKA